MNRIFLYLCRKFIDDPNRSTQIQNILFILSIHVN